MINANGIFRKRQQEEADRPIYNQGPPAYVPTPESPARAPDYPTYIPTPESPARAPDSPRHSHVHEKTFEDYKREEERTAEERATEERAAQELPEPMPILDIATYLNGQNTTKQLLHRLQRSYLNCDTRPRK